MYALAGTLIASIAIVTAQTNARGNPELLPRTLGSTRILPLPAHNVALPCCIEMPPQAVTGAAGISPRPFGNRTDVHLNIKSRQPRRTETRTRAVRGNRRGDFRGPRGDEGLRDRTETRRWFTFGGPPSAEPPCAPPCLGEDRGRRPGGVRGTRCGGARAG